jgi:eukaryotic-like serine/threonine-protein kinase
MGSTLERGALLHKRYRIVEILGQGGMGSVYRAVDENLGVDVAVKENLFASDEYARQFRLEAVLLANLRHSHLPRVTDHFVIDNQGQYLIMDYIEGEDLRQRMERIGMVSEQEALLIGVAMCDALQYLHTRKPSVIHRDVKPGNVRISPDGHIYLVDFGLAKLVKGSQATTTGARAMTPGYSPPEQYGTARTDPRTDVYSLGATLYAALTGNIPEDGLARAMDNVELTPLRKRNPTISRKLASAIEKAMAVRPEDRYQSADEFKQALVATNVKTQQLKNEIVIEPPPQVSESGEEKNVIGELSAPEDDPPDVQPPLRPHSKAKSRYKGWVFLSIFLLVILAALLSVLFFWTPLSRALLAVLVSPTPTSNPPSQNTSLAASLSPNPATIGLDLTGTKAAGSPVPSATPTFRISPTLQPTFTPTETATPEPTATLMGGGFGQIAFASNQTGAPQIFVVNADNTGMDQVTNMPDGACQPDWSPDGTRLVFTSPCLERKTEYLGSKLYIINADGSGLLELPGSAVGDFDPAWSPDGKYIAFTSMRTGSDQIFVMDLTDYGITQLTDVSTDVRIPDWSRQPAWAPDQTLIIYTGHSRLTNAQQIWAMSDVGRGQTLLIPRGPNNWNFYPAWSPDGKTILFNETNGAQTIGWLMLFDYVNRLETDATHLRPGLYANHGRYSSDGRWVVFESVDMYDSSNTDLNIYIYNIIANEQPVKIKANSGLNFDPVWRPIPLH